MAEKPHFICFASLWRLLFVVSFLFLGASGHTQTINKNFDHVKTGFALTGMHTNAPCESCHINGVFKGTPRACASCHVNGAQFAQGNVVKPAQHFQTTLGCESCHTTVTFTGARFDHLGVSAGSCSTCHNGSTAMGKSAGHVPTQDSCGTCHKSTSSWTAGVTFVHASANAIGTGTCDTCHNGTTAKGKHVGHIPVTTGPTKCDNCHTSQTSFVSPYSMNHTVVAATSCQTCHNGSFVSQGSSGASGVTANHIPYKTLMGVAIADCNTCHKAGYTTWNPGKFHANVPLDTQCASCHLSASYGATGKPATPIHASVTGNCESCHKSISNWTAGVVYTHAPANALGTGTCDSCHDGVTAQGKGASHIPVTTGPTKCDNCHTSQTSFISPYTMNHTVVAATACKTCHNGSFVGEGKFGATAVTTNHIPYAGLTGVAIADCNTCHKAGYTTWNPGLFHKNISVTTQCASCHLTTAYGVTGKPSTTVHSSVTGNCESCHKSNTSWTSGVVFAHSAANAVGTGTCDTCHNGTTAKGKHAAHIPVTTGPTKCDNCHTSQTSFVSPYTMNHTVVSATGCETCHNGSFVSQGTQGALPVTANHIPYKTITGVAIANCDTCHKGGTTLWNPGKFHANVSVSTQCASCHLTTAYGATGKPTRASHATITGNCESCHKSTSSWLGGVQYTHLPANALGTGTCDSCHNGTDALGKGTTHIPVTTGPTKCDSCHQSQTSFATPYKMNHTVVTATGCETCHNGNFVGQGTQGALPVTSNHIPYKTLTGVAIANCDTCHKGGTTLWNPGKFHANVSVSTQCASCHMTTAYGVTGKPSTTVHSSVTGNCESCHKSTTSWTSGVVFAHSAANAVGTGTCDTCHNGTTAKGKHAAHIPVTTGPTKCDNCHTSQTSFVSPYTMNHTVVAATSCQTCHNGSFVSQGTQGALPVTTNHIPYKTLTGVAIADCNTCHKAGYTTWNPGLFHKNISIATQCASCHLSTTYGATGKPANATHATVTGNCESCHKSTTSWTSGVVFAHSAANAVGTGTCDTCHNGTTAKGKHAAHIPVTTGPTKCDNCHTSQTSFVSPYTMNHTVVAATSCQTCHNGSFVSQGTQGALPVTTNHIPYKTLTGVAIADCNTCHKAGYTTWNPGLFHKNISITTQCASCHLSTTYGATGKPANATHATVTGNCESCHKSTTSWTSGVVFAHSAANAVGTGTCDTCHNGTTAKGKHAAHIPVTTGPTKCDNCHTSQTSFVSPYTMNHTVVAASTCKSCHNGSYKTQGIQGAMAKPSNHIPEATYLLNGASMDCKACHIGTSVWTNEKMNHNSSLGNGSGWCYGCHASGTAFLGSMDKKSLTHEKKTPVPTDCSMSGCHKPLGNKGRAYSAWD